MQIPSSDLESQKTASSKFLSPFHTHTYLTSAKMVQNNSLVFLEPVPASTYPVPGKHIAKQTQEIDLDQQLENGSILVKTKVLSLDPYMRSRLRAPGFKSYVPEFDQGKPLQNFGV